MKSLVKLAVSRRAYKVTREGVDVLGHTFAGFREIPRIQDEWPGEVHPATLREIVERVVAPGADILATHAPPSGILDGTRPWKHGHGVPFLPGALAYQKHDFTHHFFGHAHEDGGQVVAEMGMRFLNGAERMIVHEV